MRVVELGVPTLLLPRVVPVRLPVTASVLEDPLRVPETVEFVREDPLRLPLTTFSRVRLSLLVEDLTPSLEVEVLLLEAMVEREVRPDVPEIFPLLFPSLEVVLNVPLVPLPCG